MPNVIMIVGCPASGKGTLSKTFFSNYVHLNRDAEGGTIADLLPKMNQLLIAQKDVVLDNTYPTILSRKPFIEMAKRHNSQISCIVMSTSIEDAQINALHRMHERYGKIFMSANDIKVKDPNIFPPAALFKYRKEYEIPTMSEGFDKVDRHTFVRHSKPYTNKAIILDYDGTLRESTGSESYPTKVEEIKMLPNRKEVLNQKIKEGYLILGVSNQSGIAKGVLTEQSAIDCFKFTNQQLGIDIDFHFCPHRIPPMVCYCRKPQSGLGVLLIEKHKLDASQCIMVGDLTTDKTFAKRLGFQYQDHLTFFR